MSDVVFTYEPGQPPLDTKATSKAHKLALSTVDAHVRRHGRAPTGDELRAMAELHRHAAGELVGLAAQADGSTRP